MALGSIGPDAAAAALPAATKALNSPEEKVAYSACYALGKFGALAAPAKPALTKKLNDKDETVALAAAWALANVDPQCGQQAPVAVSVLIRGLADPEPRIRLESAAALRCMGPAAKEAAPALKNALNDKDELVRDMVRQALIATGGT